MQLKITILLVMIGVFIHANASIHYVTQNGGGTFDGTSWSNAIPGTSLQNAIDNAGVGDEIWIASGVYVPTNGLDRSIAFSLKNGVSIHGSFSGIETVLSERDLNSGLSTVFTGEIGVPGILDNSYHVFSNNNLNNTAILEGCIISDAYDDRSPTTNEGLGGGIYNDGSGIGNECSPSVINCIITNNSAAYGAGIFNNGYDGGNASPVLTNCVIVSNTAFLSGGGIDNFGLLGTANPTLSNCIVYRNSASLRAGGMYCWGGNNGSASPTVINSVFILNEATDGGGVVVDNLNASSGSSGISNPTFTNCIIWENTTTNEAPQFMVLGTSNFNATYTAVDLTNQMSPHVISGSGTGNVFSNPLFDAINLGEGVDGIWLTADDGLQLSEFSPCINSGNNSVSLTSDILNNPRIIESQIDMGAYEFESTVSLAYYQGIAKSDLFPNPSTGEIYVDLPILTNEVYGLNVFSNSGRLIYKVDYPNLTEDSQTTHLDLSYLPAGSYTLIFEIQDEVIVHKLIITD